MLYRSLPSCEQEQVPAGSPLLGACHSPTPERESLADLGTLWCGVTPLVWCVAHSLFLLGHPVVEVEVESRDVHIKILVSLKVVLDRMVV